MNITDPIKTTKNNNIQLNNFKALSKLEFWMFIDGFSSAIKIASNFYSGRKTVNAEEKPSFLVRKTVNFSH